MRLNPEHLITFAVVVQEGGVGTAARRLHLTQPAVSNQLRKLQSEVGEALYRRAGRGIALTGAGQRLYVEAQRLSAALGAAQDVAAGLAVGDTGLVRVAASQTPGAYLLPVAIAAFREQAPGIEIELESHNSQRVFERLEICDLALVEVALTQDLPPDRQAQIIGHDEIVAVLRRSDPLAKRRSLSASQLATQGLIWRETGSGTREQVEQAFADAGVVPQVRMALAGVAAVKEGVRQGLGIGFASRLALRHDNALLAGVALRPRLTRAISLITPHNPTAATARFAEFLRSYCPSYLYK